jgi:hypothetical protein
MLKKKNQVCNEFMMMRVLDIVVPSIHIQRIKRALTPGKKVTRM